MWGRASVFVQLLSEHILLSCSRFQGSRTNTQTCLDTLARHTNKQSTKIIIDCFCFALTFSGEKPRRESFQDPSLNIIELLSELLYSNVSSPFVNGQTEWRSTNNVTIIECYFRTIESQWTTDKWANHHKENSGHYHPAKVMRPWYSSTVEYSRSENNRSNNDCRSVRCF